MQSQLPRIAYDSTKPVYACKMIDITQVKQKELENIHKEVRIHGMVKSGNCINVQ